MEWLWLVVSAATAAGLCYLGWTFRGSFFKTPKERSIQVITRFGKFYAAIMSVEGQRLNDPRRRNRLADQPDWEIIPKEADYKASWSEKWNIYIYPWPFFKTYVYPFSYLKLKKRGDVQEGDHIIWTNEETGETLIARSGTSDYIDYHYEYPTVTGDLFTSEMGKVLVFTTNTLQATNPYKMLFGINNWLGVVTETLGAALRGVVGDLTLQQLNQVKSESAAGINAPSADFTNSMTHINGDSAMGTPTDGIWHKYGAKLTRSIFKAFKPADENTKLLMASFLKPQIATQEGNASKIKATLEGEATITTATAKATAYEKEHEKIVFWAKKNLVDTGLARTDADGNIIELLPDAETRVTMEAIKELSRLTGTLVLGGDLKSLLNIATTKGEPAKGGVTLS